jgi:PAS domain S-box-containing protein
LLADLIDQGGDTESNNNNVNSSSSSSSSSSISSNISKSIKKEKADSSILDKYLNMETGSLQSFIDEKGSIKQHARILMEPDYRLIQSLILSQQNFVLSDPSMPDNPIIYCSDGFCKLSGYKRDEIIGRNCRFLQGPGTDPAAVNIIREGVAAGRDISVCLLNYKADGTPFWNQFFVGALRDSEGKVVNYVGVQCEVNVIPVTEIKDRVKKLPIPDI